MKNGIGNRSSSSRASDFPGAAGSEQIQRGMPRIKKARAETRAILLTQQVGARGFESPACWSRTRFNCLWKRVESRGFLMLSIESDLEYRPFPVETSGNVMLFRLQI